VPSEGDGTQVTLDGEEVGKNGHVGWKKASRQKNHKYNSQVTHGASPAEGNAGVWAKALTQESKLPGDERRV